MQLIVKMFHAQMSHKKRGEVFHWFKTTDIFSFSESDLLRINYRKVEVDRIILTESSLIFSFTNVTLVEESCNFKSN